MDKVTHNYICSLYKDCSYYKQFKRLQAENERLKEEKGGMQILIDNYIALTEKYRQALQEIRDIVRNEVETRMLFADEKSFCDFNNILAKINEVIGAE